MPTDPMNSQRLRIRFATGELLRYVSHLDQARAWERAFRRAGLPLAYSQGFSPRPRYQIAAALPVGVTGRAELLDLWLTEPGSPEELLARLQPVSPPDLRPRDAVEVDPQAPALQSLLRAAWYRAVIGGREPGESLRARVEMLLELPALIRQRHHKGQWQTYDLRPLIEGLQVETEGAGPPILIMHLQASPQGAGRPDEVLDALGLPLGRCLVERTNLCFEFDKSVGDDIIACRWCSDGALVAPVVD